MTKTPERHNIRVKKFMNFSANIPAETPERHYTYVKFMNFSVHIPTEAWADTFGVKFDDVADDVSEYIRHNTLPVGVGPNELSREQARQLPSLGAFGSGEIKASWEWPGVPNCWNAFCIGETCDGEHHYDNTGRSWFERQGAVWNTHNNDMGEICWLSGERAGGMTNEDSTCYAGCGDARIADD